MNKTLLAVVAAGIALAGCEWDRRGASVPDAPYGLTVEYRENPVGIDTPNPRFAWKLPAGTARQRAYEIEADGWTSGKVVSADSIGIEWKGSALPSSARIGWRVRVWGESAEPSAWSEPAYFVTAIMDKGEWKARWIGPAASTRPDEDMKGAKWITGARGTNGTIVLRKKFRFDGARAGEFAEMVHAAIPQHEIRVNGKDCSIYSGHVHRWNFLRFRDITKWLRTGENEIEVKILAGDSPDAAFIAKFTLPDGRVFVTDEGWTGARALGGVREPAFAKALVMRTETKSPAFEKRFTVAKEVRSAMLHITGVGFYEARLNGMAVGDKVLDPSPTDFNRRVLYSTYDVAKALKRGENALNVLVGHGWYDVRAIATWDFATAPWRDFPRMIAQLEITYADGSKETVVSDESWDQVESPVKFDCIREGEVVSARDVGRRIASAAVVEGPKGRLEAEALPGAKVMRTLRPEAINDCGNGTYVVKFRENFAGWIRAKFRGLKDGDVVVVRYDERIRTGLMPAEPSASDGLHGRRRAVNPDTSARDDETRRIDCHFRYTASHRACATGAEFQADRLIASGAAVEEYEPRFTYNGFQYVVLTGLRQVPEPDDIVGCVVHTAFRDIGRFESSDRTLDTLVQMAERAYKSNFADGYPTDCPHREKNGWTGDASIASELAQYLFENTAAYEKWLKDLCDTQLPSGDICCIVPTSGWGYRWGNGPAWDSALPVIAWNLYVYRDDRRVLDIVYPTLKRYLAFTATKADADGLVKHGLGDWVPVDRAHMPSTELTSSCYYYQAQSIAARIAAVKGLSADAAAFAEGAAKTRRGINARFYKGAGVYDNAGQSAQAFPIAFGVVEPDEFVRVAARLAEAVERTGCHVDMGLLGTKHVFRALSRIGRTDLAYRMLVNPTKPSMMEWAQKGGTTLWEDWGDGASRNHIMFGDFAGWAYQYLAGISLPETDESCSAIPVVGARGFREVVFAPCVIGELDHVSASVDTPYGVYASSWTRSGGTVAYRFTVPAGGSATIRIAGRPDEKVGPGTYARAAASCTADNRTLR